MIASSEENRKLSRNVKYFCCREMWSTEVQKLIQFTCFVRIVHDVYFLVQTLKYQSTVQVYKVLLEICPIKSVHAIFLSLAFLRT